MQAQQPNFERSRQEATRLLEKYRITEPVVNVFEIADNEGLTIQFFDPNKADRPERLSDIAGFLDQDKKTIFINQNDPITRQTFTIAHELGHHELKHQNTDVLLRQQIYETEKPAIEKEADEFAGNLLVPLSMLKTVMKKYRLDEGSTDIKLLAGIFGVSKEVIKIRLEKLKQRKRVF